jgi:diguanylate cyclase (GGDEF)-like protein
VGTPLLRLFVLFWTAFLFAVPSAVVAAPANGDLPLTKPCILIGAATANVSTMMNARNGFDCAIDPRHAAGDTIWVRYDVRAANVRGDGGWTYDHALVQARDERVWIAYADGRIVQSSTAREQARRILGGPTQRFSFPAGRGSIVTLLIRVDGIESRRGPVPRASLTSVSRTNANRANLNLAFGVMAGIMIGILFYNVTLFAALRYGVLGAYCGSIAATLFYGAVWSNLILWIAPGMTTATQFNMNALSISFCFLATSYYFEAFVERDMLSRSAVVALKSVASFVVCASLLQFVWEPVSWRFMDMVHHFAYLTCLALLGFNAVIAWKRGSIAIKFFLSAWFLPLTVVVTRILWGIGTLPTESALFDASAFIAMSLEGLLSAVGLSWRLRALRFERDAARHQAIEFHVLAHIDPLTEIPNRRAFLAEALSLGAKVDIAQLILIDVDRFKFVNDGYGHDAGDRVLKRVARAVEAAGGDIFGRLGGDEFAIIVNGGRATATAAAVNDHLIRHIEPGDLGVTLSMGIASGQLASEQDWQLLYVAADQALYRSKRGGRAQTQEAVEPIAA